MDGATVVCGGFGGVFVAALMTDLRLKMLLKPPPVFEPGALALLVASWTALLPLPAIKLSIAPPMTAAAPTKDDPIKPAAAVVGLSEYLTQQLFQCDQRGLNRAKTTTITGKYKIN